MKKLIIFSTIIIFCISCKKSEEDAYGYMGASILSDFDKTHSKSINENIPYLEFVAPDFDGQNYFGIDVSQYQGEIDWNSVIADSLPNAVKFVICRASLGKNMIDKRFISNFEAASRKNLICGAYHVYWQHTRQPKEQARNFINQINSVGGLKPGQMIPVLDIEKSCLRGKSCAQQKDIVISKNELINELKKFIYVIEKELNTKVLIYTGEGFYKRYLKGNFEESMFWLAKYSKHFKPPICYQEFSDCDEDELVIGWQYTDKGKISGVSNVDSNKYVDINAFKKEFINKIIIE